MVLCLTNCGGSYYDADINRQKNASQECDLNLMRMGGGFIENKIHNHNTLSPAKNETLDHDECLCGCLCFL